MSRDYRFQNQPWYIKLWRYRWYLTIPPTAVYLWWYNGAEFTFKNCWRMAKGLAQGPMLWYYTLEEVKESLGKTQTEED